MLYDIGGKKRNLRGWKPDRPDHRDRRFRASLVEVPTSVDLRLFCPPIEDQGALGSCSAHASTSAMEFLYKKAGLPLSPAFSRLFVYYQTRVAIEQLSAADDSGVPLRAVMKALRTFGACLEPTWPYDMERFASAPGAEALMEGFRHRILQYTSVEGLGGVKACLAEGFPVVGGFSVPQNAMSEECLRTGVIRFPGKETILGGHAVMFVGFDDVRAHLTFHNSWGTEWGDRGYGYLPYQFVQEGLVEDLWTIRQEQI